jgi:hypothetical protein
MRLVLTGVLSAVVIASCSAAEPVAPVLSADCNVRTSVAWTEAGSGYTAQALSDGPNCALAALMLIVRDPAGKPIWTDSRPAAQLMTFQDVKDKAGMAKALTEWIDQSHSMMKRGESLPPWDHDQAQPENGEFPFYLEPGVDRELYEKYRRANGPLFCYVQGMESMACISLDTETEEMTKVGVQSFPG